MLAFVSGGFWLAGLKDGSVPTTAATTGMKPVVRDGATRKGVKGLTRDSSSLGSLVKLVRSQKGRKASSWTDPSKLVDYLNRARNRVLSFRPTILFDFLSGPPCCLRSIVRWGGVRMRIEGGWVVTSSISSSFNRKVTRWHCWMKFSSGNPIGVDKL